MTESITPQVLLVEKNTVVKSCRTFLKRFEVLPVMFSECTLN